MVQYGNNFIEEIIRLPLEGYKCILLTPLLFSDIVLLEIIPCTNPDR